MEPRGVEVERGLDVEPRGVARVLLLLLLLLLFGGGGGAGGGAAGAGTDGITEKKYSTRWPHGTILLTLNTPSPRRCMASGRQSTSSEVCSCTAQVA